MVWEPLRCAGTGLVPTVRGKKKQEQYSGVGTGVAEGPWPHQYFNKKGRVYYVSILCLNSCSLSNLGGRNRVVEMTSAGIT